MERIGFIGIGVMGKPMCLNLRKAGFPLTIYARRPGAAREVVDAGANLVDSSRAVAEASDVVITMLTNSPDVEEVVLGSNGVLEGARCRSEQRGQLAAGQSHPPARLHRHV